MPLYDFRCPSCHEIDIDIMQPSNADAPICQVCQISMEKFHGGKPSAVHIFKEGFYEHVAEQPIYFRNKKDLKSFCKERGLTMDYCE